MRRFLAAFILVLILAGTLAFGPSRQRPQRTAPMRFEATAYCIDGVTKSGIQTRKGIIAADPRVLPLGSVVRVEGLRRHNGKYTVADTGRTIKGREIDIYMDDCRAAKRFGRQPARVRILSHGSSSPAGPAR